MTRPPVTDVASERAAIEDSIAGRTVPDAFLATVRARPGADALSWRVHGGWASWTWGEYADHVARYATGLRELGVGAGCRVLLMLRNRPEFHALDLAVSFLGGTPISVYNTSPAEQVAYLAQHSRAVLAVADDPEFCNRFLKVRSATPALRHLLVLDDPADLTPADVVPLDRISDRPRLDLEGAVSGIAPDDLATIIYTSGTTGPPKGVRITQANVLWTVQSLLRRFGRSVTGKRFISYLPMAHIAERMVTHYIHTEQGSVVTTCPDPARIGEYLPEVQPQLLFAVPRVLEKAHARISSMAAADPDRGADFDRAVETGLAAARVRVEGGEPDDELRAAHEQAEAEVLATVRALTGLDRCEALVSAAAPIPAEILEFFLALGVPTSELYGQSESCGPLTWEPWQVRPGTVGRPIPGCEVRLGDDGEVLARGGNVFAGYLDEPDKTASTLADGWLHTGDLGAFDDDGYLRIVGRKKDLIVTAGGDNVAPSNIEEALKLDPLVSQACVVGDRRPHLVALVTLDPEVAPGWARAHGIEATSTAALARHPDVRAAVQTVVDRVNGARARIEQVKRFTILDHDWPPDSDVLTPTMKVKRNIVRERYADEIEALYR